jgi:hypothetical protein
MSEIGYDFDSFPEPLRTRIATIARQRGCSVDEVMQGLWLSFVTIVESGMPELTGLAKEIQEAQSAPRKGRPKA